MYHYKAFVKDVYDGDTITAVVDLGFLHYQEMKLRLYGIDTPELRGPERPQGLIVRDILRDLILEKEVEIHTYKDKQGKYGRYLATIMLDELNINEWLVSEGHATVYLP
ncbi:MAG: thermonuclease family protein [Flavobacteriaceae bacterium]|nr:thermonuclease family protein [Flavobacteriaceae bacterium]